MENSKISWTDHTFNSWLGCARISAGCVHCYAEALSKRFNKAGWGVDAKRVKTSAAYWRKPLEWNAKAVERKKVFCGSMCDVFEDNPQVANWRGELFQLIDATPNLDWLLLTKRADKIFGLGTDAAGEMFDNWLARHPNVWLGATIENQDEADKRVWQLASMCAAVRFLSVEPMLEDIYIPQIRRFDWVICGGESGAGARPFEWDWARKLRDQCLTAGVPFFMKQGGGARNKRDTFADIPEDLQIREFPRIAEAA